MEDIVFGENEKTTPNRVIVLDDLMTEAFGVRDNESMMNLLMMKLSHHNNISVLIVCHIPQGKELRVVLRSTYHRSPPFHSKSAKSKEIRLQLPV